MLSIAIQYRHAKYRDTILYQYFSPPLVRGYTVKYSIDGCLRFLLYTVHTLSWGVCVSACVGVLVKPHGTVC